MIPHPDAALAEYESYARNALVQLRRVPLGDQIEEDHMRNRQLIIHWLIDNSDAVAVERRDGKTYYRVTSPEAFRKGCGVLLAEVMRIKATGDAAAGKALVERYGTKVDPVLHREVLARIKKLELPSSTGFVMPELQLVRDASGNVVADGCVAVDAERNIVESGERTVVLLGVSDLIVVDAGDAVLVCHRDRAQQVGKIPGELRARGKESLT